jgi:ankyrin repeat protein
VVCRRNEEAFELLETVYSALMFAAMAMNNSDDALKTVQVLLGSGVNRGLKNMDGKTALDLAKDHKQPKIVALLQGQAVSGGRGSRKSR